MAITFQEKSNLGKKIAVLLALFLIFAAVIFFGWRFIEQSFTAPPALPAPAPALNVEVLQDPRLAEMEMFPRISPPEEEITRENPFAEVPATTTADTGGED
jgi:hypothetical protein